MIIKISDNVYQSQSGNTKLTLKHNDLYGWHVYAENPATRAYKTMGFKQLGTLGAVEKHYKAFKGISLLLGSN